MSRAIKINEHEELVQKIIETIRDTKMVSGEFTFSAKLPELERRAQILFTPEAYSKMLSLIMTFDKEVGWYVTAHREGEMDDDIYVIDDVLVFPQEVTGATVDSRDEERIEWFNTIPVEKLVNIRGDFHSHVNMSTSPSGTDDKEVKEVLENLDGDAFRIFMIWNKKLEFTARIYDMGKNIFFGTRDVEVGVIGCDIAEFLGESKEMVKTKTYTTTSKKNEKKKEKKKESPIVDEIEDLFDDEFEYDYYSYPRRTGKSNYSSYYGYY